MSTPSATTGATKKVNGVSLLRRPTAVLAGSSRHHLLIEIWKSFFFHKFIRRIDERWINSCSLLYYYN